MFVLSLWEVIAAPFILFDLFFISTFTILEIENIPLPLWFYNAISLIINQLTSSFSYLNLEFSCKLKNTKNNNNNNKINYVHFSLLFVVALLQLQYNFPYIFPLPVPHQRKKKNKFLYKFLQMMKLNLLASLTTVVLLKIILHLILT